MMRVILKSVGLLLLAFVSSCTHAYNIAPDNNLLMEPEQEPLELSAHWAPSEAEMALLETRSAPAGDKIEYGPFRDLAASIDLVLSNCFATLESDPEQADLVFRVRIITTPGWGNGFIWPPTDFGIALDVKALDQSDEIVWERTVSGSGITGWGDMQGNFSLAGQIAAVQVLNELQASIMEAEELQALAGATP